MFEQCQKTEAAFSESETYVSNVGRSHFSFIRDRDSFKTNTHGGISDVSFTSGPFREERPIASCFVNRVSEELDALLLVVPPLGIAAPA
jgi:hypothetical protein